MPLNIESVLSVKSVNPIFSTFLTDNDRLLAAYSYFSGIWGQLSEEKFLDRLTTDLGNFPAMKTKVGPDDKIFAPYLETVIGTWKDIPEMAAAYDQLKLFDGKSAAEVKQNDENRRTQATAIEKARGLVVYDYPLTNITPRKFADALFTAMRKADTNNPQSGAWTSPSAFIEFCKNWRNYLN